MGATHHMTRRREYFSDLDTTVRGSVKFGDTTTMEIAGAGSVIFVAKMGEHRLLTDVYYIPALRNSIISLGSWTRMDQGWRSRTACLESGIRRVGFSPR